MRIVKSLKLLKSMAENGKIILHEDTGKMIKPFFGGRLIKCYYVSDYGPNGTPNFTHRNKTYKLTYRNGSHYPYVEEVY